VAKPFRVDVVSPEATVWSGEATFVVAKTPDGELGIMADHEPLLAALVTSAVEVEGVDGSRTIIGVHGGFLQVLKNQVTLLTDRAQISTGNKEEANRLASNLADQEAASNPPGNNPGNNPTGSPTATDTSAA
jgi:F-type H+-transporting ATPase subunit epsilon